MPHHRYSPSPTLCFLYTLGLLAWLLWAIRLPDSAREVGALRYLFPALGFLITSFLSVVFCLDRDAQRQSRPGFPIEPIAVNTELCENRTSPG